MIRRIIHIAPHLPPNVGGVGDYATILGQRIAEVSDGAISSCYIAAGFRRGQRPDPALVAADLAACCDAGALRHAIEDLASDADSACALLHYVGYGYAAKGAPLWLLGAVRRLRRERSNVRFVTMFHELFAAGRPWQSAFWLSPVQRWLAGELARSSDAVMASRSASALWLERRGLEHPVVHSPIFSNVGELESPPPWEDRERVAVVFGASRMKARIYQRSAAVLRRLFDRAGIERIWDIGPRTVAWQSTLAGRPVAALGVLSREEVSARLRVSRLGVVRYPLAFLTKSGAAAAYLAHAVPLLVTGAGARPSDYDGPPCLTEETHANASLLHLGMQGFAWYHRHAHSVLAARRLLVGLAPDPTLRCSPAS